MFSVFDSITAKDLVVGLIGALMSLLIWLITRYY
jgi:hypothetical protein